VKRMNVREFRKNVSSLTQEPIEVVRYTETIGFWVPQSMTTEPAKKPRVSRAKPIVSSRELDIDLLSERLKEMRAAMLARERRASMADGAGQGAELK
jgi:hypothetical protein